MQKSVFAPVLECLNPPFPVSQGQRLPLYMQHFRTDSGHAERSFRSGCTETPDSLFRTLFRRIVKGVQINDLAVRILPFAVQDRDILPAPGTLYHGADGRRCQNLLAPVEAAVIAFGNQTGERNFSVFTESAHSVMAQFAIRHLHEITVRIGGGNPRYNRCVDGAEKRCDLHHGSFSFCAEMVIFFRSAAGWRPRECSRRCRSPSSS